jgi:hypothetical protein
MGASSMKIREFCPVWVGNDFAAIVQVEEVPGHAGLIRKAGFAGTIL